MSGRARVLVVDGANVVGSRPDGWWKDRARAASRLHDQLAMTDSDDLGAYDEIVLVLEGQARAGVPEGRAGTLRTVHAPRDGDATIVALARRAVSEAVSGEADVVVVTADRALQMRAEGVGARTHTPGWLLDRL
jgi:predicted RNA-binding protein with PIN domain